MSWWKKLKSRWQIESDFAALMIILNFSLTGSASIFVSRYAGDMLSNWFDLPGWIITSIKVIMVFISYQVILLIFGFLLGQFRFFWNQQKKILRFFARMFPN